MADDTVFRTMLFDFYGELLTDKQREYFDLHYNEDLSLAEIAALSGVSRQAVWDNIRRAESSLREIEGKVGLVERWQRQREALCARLESLTGKTVSLTCRPDPTLLGGITLRYGGIQLDDSIRSRLERLRRSLSQTVV